MSSIFSHFDFFSFLYYFVSFILQTGVIHEYSAGKNRKKTAAKKYFENKKSQPAKIGF